MVIIYNIYIQGDIVETDKLLRVMPNVVLALKLLNESHKEDSFWKPYIGILLPYSKVKSTELK